MLKFKSCTLTALLVSLGLASSSANADSLQRMPTLGAENATPQADGPSKAILGKWQHPDEPVIVEVTEAGGVFSGKIIKGPKPDKPTVFRGLRYDAKEGVWKGRAYAPDKEKVYDATWRLAGKTLYMKVEVGIFSKTLEWSRV